MRQGAAIFAGIARLTAANFVLGDSFNRHGRLNAERGEQTKQQGQEAAKHGANVP